MKCLAVNVYVHELIVYISGDSLNFCSFIWKITKNRNVSRCMDTLCMTHRLSLAHKKIQIKTMVWKICYPFTNAIPFIRHRNRILMVANCVCTISEFNNHYEWVCSCVLQLANRMGDIKTVKWHTVPKDKMNNENKQQINTRQLQTQQRTNQKSFQALFISDMWACQEK